MRKYILKRKNTGQYLQTFPINRVNEKTGTRIRYPVSLTSNRDKACRLKESELFRIFDLRQLIRDLNLEILIDKD